MKLKCNNCGKIRTKKAVYTGKYSSTVSEENILILSNRGVLRLNCPKCGNTLHTVVEE